jgi:hypothetical protein
MKLIILLVISIMLFSCKTSKNSNCDAYSQKEIKKDHQI